MAKIVNGQIEYKGQKKVERIVLGVGTILVGVLTYALSKKHFESLIEEEIKDEA